MFKDREKGISTLFFFFNFGCSILFHLNFIVTYFSLLIGMDADDGQKPIKNKPRGMTRKAMIIKNRSKGIKLLIKYNQDGIYVGDSSVHLTSYLGVLARTMVPIRYRDWRDVLISLKDNLWDSIEVTNIYSKRLVIKYYHSLQDENINNIVIIVDFFYIG